MHSLHSDNKRRGGGGRVFKVQLERKSKPRASPNSISEYIYIFIYFKMNVYRVGTLQTPTVLFNLSLSVHVCKASILQTISVGVSEKSALI